MRGGETGGLVQMHTQDKPGGERTEEKILDAAFDVLQQRTIGGTRMAAIAARAGLFQSNIHYYYKSKRDLLLAVQQKVLQRCITLRRELRAQSACSGLRDELDCFWGQKRRFILEEPWYDYAEIDFWSQSRVDQAMREQMVHSFCNWRREIEDMLAAYAADMDQARRRLLAAVMVSMMEGASMQYLADPEAFDLDEYFAYCGRIVLREIKHEAD